MQDFFLDVSPEESIKLQSDKQSSGQDTQGSKIEGIFNVISGNLNPELVSKTNAVFQFEVKGR